MYQVEVKPAQKVMLVTVSGFLKMDEATAYMKEFKTKLASINPRDYHLIIDGKDQKTVSGDVQELLADALKLYVTTPFKSHRTVVLNSAITKSQVMRAGNTAFANTFQFHDSVEDALRHCN